MKPHETDALTVIDKWFSGKCGGLWEHQNGLALTTTDNPGWLITVDEVVDESLFNNVSSDVREQWNAECIRESNKIKVYATSLPNCIRAVAYILGRSAIS